MTTVALTGWIAATLYTWRVAGPLGIFRALRSDGVPARYKVILAVCALPIPGPVDEIIAAVVLARIACGENGS